MARQKAVADGRAVRSGTGWLEMNILHFKMSYSGELSMLLRLGSVVLQRRILGNRSRRAFASTIGSAQEPKEAAG